MRKKNGKASIKGRRGPDPKDYLKDLLLQFELMTNELFHLKEYVSLIDYDPLERNNSELFQGFLRDNDLILEDVLLNSNQESGTANSEDTTKVRRRQLRNRNATEVDISCMEKLHKFKEIDPLVNLEFEKLRSKYPTIKIASKPGHSDIPIKRESDKVNSIPLKGKRRKPTATKTVKHENAINGSTDIAHKKEIFHDDCQIKHDTSHESNYNNSNSICDYNDNDDNNNDDDFYFTTSSEDELDRDLPRIKKRKIKAYVKPPTQTITNPANVVHIQYPNLREYFNSFKSLDEDMDTEEYDAFISEQRRIAKAIKDGVKNGVLRIDPNSGTIQPITTKGMGPINTQRPDPVSYFYKEQNLQTYQDYLLNHGIFMSRLIDSNKRSRIARARRVSQMVEQHFKYLAGAEERKTRELEKRKRALARSVVQIVRKRWTTAEKAYKVLKRDELEQLKKMQGKEHLSRMLEKSTMLLGAQLNKTGEDYDTIGTTDTSGGETLSDDNGNENNDDTLTSSEEESYDADNFTGKISRYDSPDESLSILELKEKYKSLNSTSDIDVTRGPAAYGSQVSTTDEIHGLDSSYSSEADDSVTTESSSDESSSETEQNLAKTKPSLLGSLYQESVSDDDASITEDSSTFERSPSPSKSEGSEYKQVDGVEDNHKSLTGEGFSNIDPKKSVDNTRDIPTVDSRGAGHDISVQAPEQARKSPVSDVTTTEEQLSVEDVPVPFLLRGELRTYQKQGLNWLASLYNNQTNGILADEMGLGKTIQTISLLAYLACEKENWGPHLIVVPTSVLLNWEMEFKRFAPGFKVMTYYGSPQQRKEKRKGWNKSDSFHVCIVSYQLVVQDQHSFKRKKWKYMVLDEAHNIKNFRSNRWQALLNFNTQRRLLLTGTPLQNNLAELWSLLYFLMPKTVVDGEKVSGFADLEAFQQWFGRPVDKIIETGESLENDAETKKTVAKLHQVLRPYLLRRLKKDVEQQMPGKHEHIIYCRLSKRQRYLYDDFMSRAQTKATLASGNFMSIVNCLMQLRKVCNHPDLFEVRPILTSFYSGSSAAQKFSRLNWYMTKMLNQGNEEDSINMDSLNLVFTKNEQKITTYDSQEISRLKCLDEFVQEVEKLRNNSSTEGYSNDTQDLSFNFQNANEFFKKFVHIKKNQDLESVQTIQYINSLRCEVSPVYGKNLLKLLTIQPNTRDPKLTCMEELMTPIETRFYSEKHIIDKYAVLTPKAITLDMRELTLGLDDSSSFKKYQQQQLTSQFNHAVNPFHHLQTKLTIAFPDKTLLQYDCGKLQELAKLLQNLKDNGHRALIFTQMTKVLDILELFLNYHGYLYMRLDGATKIEDRQLLTERFNKDPRVTVFILSSRSGGLGINLTGADTVIFYDSDWNPAMDKQCQDRCHRIGQTRDVHIYRFVSEHTIESNILKKANQKRELDNVVIQKGDFTTDYFNKLSMRDLLSAELPTEVREIDEIPWMREEENVRKDPKELERLLAQAEDADDARAANLAMREVEIDNEDFDENARLNPETGDNFLQMGPVEDEYEGTKHVEEYMLRFIANDYYY